MKWLLIMLAVWLLAGCAELPPVAHRPLSQPNSCLRDARSYRAACHGRYHARLLAVIYVPKARTDGFAGHALCVLEWTNKTGSTAVYAYDQIFGCRKIGPPSVKDDPMQIASLWAGSPAFVQTAYFMDK